MTSTRATLGKLLSRAWRDESGGVLVYTAILLPVVLGFAGLSTDVGLWYMNKRVLQSSADAAAVSGALEIKRGGTSSEAILAATNSAGENGYTAGGDTITINNPPTSGEFAGQTDAVEVIIERPESTLLATLVYDEAVTVAARAVASAGINDACVWALDPSAKSAVKASGGAQIDLSCGVIALSSHGQALTQSGSSCLTADSVYTVGGYSGDCIDPTPTTGIEPPTDPLASMAAPSYAGCDYNSNIRANNGQTVNLSPGVYCGNITANPGGTINFGSGLYVLDGSALTINGTATGADVSFYITAGSGQNDNISFAATSNVTLSAATDGDMPGVLFYQDRAGAAGVNHTFTGQSNLRLEGILYFPNQDLRRWIQLAARGDLHRRQHGLLHRQYRHRHLRDHNARFQPAAHRGHAARIARPSGRFLTASPPAPLMPVVSKRRARDRARLSLTGASDRACLHPAGRLSPAQGSSFFRARASLATPPARRLRIFLTI
jgi:hypothetical protein